MYKKNYLKVISYLAIISALISLYLISLHYIESESTFCNYNEVINCDIVNKSTYSEIFNIPIAVFSSITFTIIALLSYSITKNKTYTFLKRRIHQKHLYIALLILLTWSILFALYLLYIEFFVLYALCLFCVILDLLILEMFILAINAYGGGTFGIKQIKKIDKGKVK